jgi:VanZ family protein
MVEGPLAIWRRKPGMHETDTPTRYRLVTAWAACCAFVVYGSLVPFRYRALDMATAIERFQAMPWLDIDLGGRLDWIANLLLYLPVGFLGTLALAGRGSKASGIAQPLVAVLLSLTIGTALAVGIEFAQIFFAPRTVSLNDLAAEVVGCVVGCIGAALVGTRFRALILSTWGGNGTPSGAWLTVYLLAYLGLSFFPFDFSAASAILDQKLQRGHAGWWWAAINMQQPQLAVMKLAAEALLTVPFGLALGSAPRRLGWVAAAGFGFVVGAVIEISQLFLLSATSQGVSVLSRAIGFALGAWLATRRKRVASWTTARNLRLLVALAVGPWLLIVAYLTGWGRTEVNTEGWMQRAAELNYLPFYYHYFVGEARALTSLLLVAGTYAWIGVAWALAARSDERWAAALAFVVAAGFEASRLALADLRPDPTNALIAAASAWLACRVVGLLRNAPPEPVVYTSKRATFSDAGTFPDDRLAAPQSVDAASFWGVSAGLLIVAGVQLATGHIAATAIGAMVFAGCIWRHPLSALTLTPILIGLSDVTAYTGQRWLNPIDVFMLTLLAVALLRSRDGPRDAARPAPRWVWLSLICGLLPSLLIAAHGADWNDPGALLTPLNLVHGVLMGKGLAWSLVLLLFVGRHTVVAHDAAIAFGRGMCLALAGVVLLTVYERLAFVGPFDFTSDYRAPGPFTEIALGGAYIECFLAAATPFAVVAAFHERLTLLRWSAAALVVAATYTTMITFSRGGQVVFLAAVIGTIFVMLGSRQLTSRRSGSRFARWSKGAVLTGAVSVLAASVLLAPYATSRFERLGEDAGGRSHHWAEGLSFSQSDAVSTAFGNGLGSFGRTSYIQGDARTRPGMFAIDGDGGQHWLRSQSGSLSYLDQRIDVRYGEPLLLSARVRSPDGKGMQALVCEKDLVQSRHCGSVNLRVPASAAWQSIQSAFTLSPNPQAGWPPRPLRFTLFNGGIGSVDLDDLSLKSAHGRELLRNGDFESLTSHWLYSSDRHLTWHLKNLWLQIYFESGWAGVLAHALLLVCAVVGAWRAAHLHGPYCMAFAVALLAFQGVGLIDSVIDSPRFLQLYLSLALLASCTLDSRRQSGRHGHRLHPAAKVLGPPASDERAKPAPREYGRSPLP